MDDVSDARLLAQFARNHSEAAFATLVQRHIALVHSVALRHTANPEHAKDITQAVFIVLARKAGALSPKTVLPGWLYHTARLTGANFQRVETRRIRREQEAFMQSTLKESTNDTLWQELLPQLDEAMACLGANDRDALVLRYFQNKSVAEVGEFLGLEENTAQRRVSRALEKLRKFLRKRGVDSAAAAISGTISANSVQAAPVVLAKSVTAVALAKGAAASVSTLTLVKGALKIMTWTKTKSAVAACAGVLLVAGTATVVVRETGLHARRLTQMKSVSNTYPGDWIWEPYSESFNRVPPIFLLQPSALPAKTVPYFYFAKDGYMARGQTLKELLTTIWSQKNSSLKLIFDADLPEDKFDFIVTFQPHWWNKLESELNKRFNLVEQIETRETGKVVVVKNEP